MKIRKKRIKPNYFERLIDNDDKASSKRFLGLLMSGFLIVAFIVVLFTKVPNANAELLDRAMLYAFLIVLVSIFGLAVDKVGDIALKINKTKAAARILSPNTVDTIENVEGNVEVPPGKTKGQRSNNPDDIKNMITEIDEHINYD